jgi:hypothetical protein
MQKNDEYLIIERLGQALLVSFFNVVVGWLGQLVETEILWKDEVAQRNCAILGYFFLNVFT